MIFRLGLSFLLCFEVTSGSPQESGFPDPATLSADDDCSSSHSDANAVDDDHSCSLSALQLQSHNVIEQYEDDAISTNSCEQRFPEEAKVVKGYMGNGSNRVLLFGWQGCPCTGIAQERLSEASVCYQGRTWANPKAELMAYLQCREGDSSHHSFIYFRSGPGPKSTWTFAGNGFAFQQKAMPEVQLQAKIEVAAAKKTCKQVSVQRNLFGAELEECRVGSDPSGSWMDDGKCTEQNGGVHEICIEKLPADFSSATHQSAWSEERAGKRHCVCIGAWSLYMTDAAKHKKEADDIMPHCKSIPQTVLTTRYLQNWKDWNGYSASIVNGVKELVTKCLHSVSERKLKCGLAERFLKLRAEVPELKTAQALESLSSELQQLSCEEDAKQSSREAMHTSANATVLTISDLQGQYSNIFKSGNRNAASFKWFSFIASRDVSHHTFQTLNQGYCPISGSPITGENAALVTLSKVGGGSASGVVHFCCTPCICDMIDLIKVDTKTLTLGSVSKQYDVVVHGNPCSKPEKLTESFTDPFSHKEDNLKTSAPEVICEHGELRGAIKSDHGHPVIGLLFASASSHSYDGTTKKVEQMCEGRAQAGYNSGMGLIFRKVASISPILN
eukprot:TRINITY_DN42005_c0_g1_i1.p1 TRINITY_DN42005_c0_g1~~TRINITY_DN42005_c0_g1_i1.p1  ORF type:complete len:615 (+),score=134.82 TRINITY_DN42005_c0_g1_i1:66-1910(+)